MRCKTLCTNVSPSIRNNTELLQQLESGFKRTINWSKCRCKITNLAKKTTI